MQELGLAEQTHSIEEVKLKIIGFLQVRNEMLTGHLQRFLDRNAELLDHLVAIDDSSEDETVATLIAFGATVITNAHSNFRNELENKSRLLEAVSTIASEGDAILWLDADEVIYASRDEMQSLIAQSFSSGFDSISFNHLNLWRSNMAYRVDDQYFGLQPVRVWKFSNQLFFPIKPGLHNQSHPNGLVSTLHTNLFPTVHYGFASLELILEKYRRYYLDWQHGYPLDRLVSESGLQTVPLTEYFDALGSRFNDFEHSQANELDLRKISAYEWQAMAQRERSRAEAGVTPLVTIVSLIYKSVSWLEFSYGEMLRLRRDFRRGEVRLLFVLNDGTPEVKTFLEENYIPFVVASGRKSETEWYINSVYRAYNEGVAASTTDWVYLINSDMAFEPGALMNVFLRRDTEELTTSRLVERGAMPTGRHGLEKDFGSRPSNFRKRDFRRFARAISVGESHDGGLYMPLFVNRATFMQTGCYPEGNVKRTGLASFLRGGEPEIAQVGEDCVPGDVAWFRKVSAMGIQHKTSFDSVCYHFQEGEKRDTTSRKIPSGLSLVNDLMLGINGEEVLWTRLAEVFQLSRARGLVTTGKPKGKIDHFLNPLKLFMLDVKANLRAKHRLSFSNATFQVPLKQARFNAVLVQDRPPRLIDRLGQKISVELAHFIFSNDLEFLSEKRRNDPIWLEISTPPAKKTQKIHEVQSLAHGLVKRPTGVFVGSCNETKGWSLFLDLVADNQQMDWIVISKYRDDDCSRLVQYDNARLLRALPHDKVLEIVATCSVFVCTSPKESQHLAGMEAVKLGVPIYSTPTGFLGFGINGKTKYGWVSDRDGYLENFKSFMLDIDSYRPSEWSTLLESEGEEHLYKQIHELLERTFEVTKPKWKLVAFTGRLRSFIVLTARVYFRRFVIPNLLRIKSKLGVKS